MANIQENNVNNSCYNQSENKNQITSLPCDKILWHCERKMKVVNQKMKKQANYFEICHISLVLNQWPLILVLFLAVLW